MWYGVKGQVERWSWIGALYVELPEVFSLRESAPGIASVAHIETRDVETMMNSLGHRDKALGHQAARDAVSGL